MLSITERELIVRELGDFNDLLAYKFQEKTTVIGMFHYAGQLRFFA